MNKIMRLSYKFRLLTQFLLCVSPLLTLLVWIFAPHLPEDLFRDHLPRVYPLVFTPLIQSLGFLADMIPTATMMYVFYELTQLFRHYEKGHVFIMENVRHYRNLGFAILSSVLAQMISHTLLTLILSMKNPPHHHLLVLQFGTGEFKTLAIGAFILLIAWVMKEAQQLADDHALTI